MSARIFRNNDLAPSHEREMTRDAAPADSAADDNDAGAVGEGIRQTICSRGDWRLRDSEIERLAALLSPVIELERIAE